jgi:hypothetical protein
VDRNANYKSKKHANKSSLIAAQDNYLFVLKKQKKPKEKETFPVLPNVTLVNIHGNQV